MLVVIVVAIVIGMIRLQRGVSELKSAGHKGLEGYYGVIYRNPNDARLWVPKLAGVGYTLNFAHPWAWPVMIAILAVPLGFILIVALGRLL
jgi:uncharacterized membrane protein